MPNYIVDDNGDFIVDDNGDFLVAPSDSYGVKEEVQKFSTSNLITLFVLDLTNLEGAEPTDILRFTSTVDENNLGENIPVVFDGNTYFPVPVEASGFEITSSGTMPAPTLKVLNTPTIQSGIISLQDMLGATLYRIRTFKTFLDNGETPDPTATFPIDVFKIDRKVQQNEIFVEWELASSIDQEGRMIPARQVIKDYCTHIYRRWNPETLTFDYSKATCPYSGAGCYNEKDELVSESQDRCGKRLSSCKRRFGNFAELPTRAFPGAGAVR